MNIRRTIKTLISKLPTSLIPTRAVTIRDSRSEPPSLASGMTVDRVASVISEAEFGDTKNLFSLYRDVILTDSHLQGEFTKRKLAVLGDVLSFMPYDKKNAADIAAASRVEVEISQVKGWMRANSFLLDSALYPVSVLEKVFSPFSGGYRLAALVPVPYQLLDFMDGKLKICETDDRGNPTSEKHEPDPNRYIIHRGHLLSSPDNWGGPMRSILFWWLLSAMDREWWTRFLDRYGSPFLLGKFDDEEGRTILESAFALATRLGGLVTSKETEVEIKQAAAGESGDAYEKFLTLCQREKSKLVIGQTLSAEAQKTGLGDGQATIQDSVRQDIRRFDGKLLAETLHDQLIVQICQINNLPGQPPTLSWGSESTARTHSTITTVKEAYAAGLELTDDSIYVFNERVGLDFRRRSGPAIGGQVFTLPPFRQSPDLDMVAENGAADLSRAFRGSLAPIARIIRESKSPAECEERIRTFCVGFNPGKVSRILADALTAYTANGSIPRRTI